MAGQAGDPSTRPKVERPAGSGAKDARGLADHLADGGGADRRQLAAEVLGDGRREPFDLLGRARELRPQVLALGGDAGRARVEVALARHIAAEGDEGSGAEGEFLGPEERRDQ